MLCNNQNLLIVNCFKLNLIKEGKKLRVLGPCASYSTMLRQFGTRWPWILENHTGLEQDQQDENGI